MFAVLPLHAEVAEFPRERRDLEGWWLKPESWIDAAEMEDAKPHISESIEIGLMLMEAGLASELKLPIENKKI